MLSLQLWFDVSRALRFFLLSSSFLLTAPAPWLRAVTLLAPNEAGRPMFSAAEAGTFFTQNATTIFPRKKHSFKFWRTVRNIFRPAYRVRAALAVAHRGIGWLPANVVHPTPLNLWVASRK